MNIHLATDHAGFDLKEIIKPWLEEQGHVVIDHGALEKIDGDDYPDYIARAAEAVSDQENDRAIIFGGSGQGEDTVADKFPHVRSAVFYGGPLEIVRLSREHNDANILSIGARFVTEEEARQAITLFLETDFSDEERHIRRLEKVEEIEERQ